MNKYDLLDLIMTFLIGGAMVLIVSFVFYDIRDREKCTNKGGVWIEQKCMKKEYFLEVE